MSEIKRSKIYNNLPKSEQERYGLNQNIDKEIVGMFLQRKANYSTTLI